MGLKNILNKEIKLKGVKTEYLSFDFGNHDIRIVRGNYTNNKLSLKDFNVINFDKEIYQNGKILEFDIIVDSIKKYIKENNVKIRNSIFTINSTESIIRSFEITAIDSPQEQDSAIRLEIMEKFPGNFDDYALEYRIVGRNDTNCEVLSCALPKHLIEEKIRLFKECGLTLKFIDIQANSLCKLINYTIDSSEIEDYSRDEKETTTIALVDLSSSMIGVNIYRAGKLEFQRTVNNDFYNVYNKVFFMSRENLTSDDYIDVNNDEECKAALDKTIEDIEKSFKFYTSRGLGNVIDEIFVHGYYLALNNTEQTLNNRFGTNVKRISTLKDIVKFQNSSDETKDIGLFVNSISSLIRYE